MGLRLFTNSYNNIWKTKDEKRFGCCQQTVDFSAMNKSPRPVPLLCAAIEAEERSFSSLKMACGPVNWGCQAVYSFQAFHSASLG